MVAMRNEMPIGEAVFIRTDTPDYLEEPRPFFSLDELVELCSQIQQQTILERIVLFGSKNGRRHSLTLGFISASEGLLTEKLTV